jgi:hypothetical protein
VGGKKTLIAKPTEGAAAPQQKKNDYINRGRSVSELRPGDD